MVVPSASVSDTGVSTGIHTNWFPSLSCITKPLFTFSGIGADVPSPQLDVVVFTGLYPAGMLGLFALGASPFIVLVFSKKPSSSVFGGCGIPSASFISYS